MIVKPGDHLVFGLPHTGDGTVADDENAGEVGAQLRTYLRGVTMSVIVGYTGPPFVYRPDPPRGGAPTPETPPTEQAYEPPRCLACGVKGVFIAKSLAERYTVLGVAGVL